MKVGFKGVKSDIKLIKYNKQNLEFLCSGPSCSKHRLLNELVNDKLVNCCNYGIFRYIDSLLQKNVSSFCKAKAIHIFSANNINMFAIFQDRILNVTLANNFVKL